MNLIKKIIITGFGTGYLPIAPGTWGSIVVVLLWLVLVWTQVPVFWITIILLVITAAASAGCLMLGGFAERYFGEKDPRRCTLDEIAGQAIALLIASLALKNGQGCRWDAWYKPYSPILISAGAFFIFRILDILKPFPANQAQKLPGGTGILLDDIIAGIYAGVLTYLSLSIYSRYI